MSLLTLSDMNTSIIVPKILSKRVPPNGVPAVKTKDVVGAIRYVKFTELALPVTIPPAVKT